MLNRTPIKRSLAAGLTIAAAAVPTGAQARFVASPASPSSSPVAVQAALPQPGQSAQTNFQWGDAGIGAAGAIVLLGAGVAGSSAVRRRRAHRAVIG